MVRETPFNLAHLRNMTAVTEMGGIVFPPLPAFYAMPKTIEELVDQTVTRVLDLFALSASQTTPWSASGTRSKRTLDDPFVAYLRRFQPKFILFSRIQRPAAVKRTASP